MVVTPISAGAGLRGQSVVWPGDFRSQSHRLQWTLLGGNPPASHTGPATASVHFFPPEDSILSVALLRV